MTMKRILVLVCSLAWMSCERAVTVEQEPELIDFQIVETLHEPRLVSPKDGAILLRSRLVSLRWGNIITATRYTVQVSRDTSFSSFLFSVVTDTTAIQTPPLEGALFYWRVRATNVRLTSPWSSIRLFVISLE